VSGEGGEEAEERGRALGRWLKMVDLLCTLVVLERGERGCSTASMGTLQVQEL
jgi:hypothetical protein